MSKPKKEMKKTERSRWSLRGIVGMAWGGVVGAVSGALAGLVAPIRGVYMKVSGQESDVKKLYKPGPAPLWRKFLGGVAALASTIFTLPAGAVYGAIGAVQGLAHGIYTGHLTFNPVTIGRPTLGIILRPFYMRAAVVIRRRNDPDESIFSLHRSAVIPQVNSDNNLGWLKAQAKSLGAKKSSLRILNLTFEKAAARLEETPGEGPILTPSSKPNTFFLSIREKGSNEVYFHTRTYQLTLRDDGKLEFEQDSTMLPRGEVEAGRPHGAPEKSPFTFAELAHSLSAPPPPPGSARRKSSQRERDASVDSRMYSTSRAASIAGAAPPLRFSASHAGSRTAETTQAAPQTVAPEIAPTTKVVDLNGILVFDFDEFLTRFHTNSMIIGENGIMRPVPEGGEKEILPVQGIAEISSAWMSSLNPNELDQIVRGHCENLMAAAAYDLQKMKGFFQKAMDNGWAICIASFNPGLKGLLPRYAGMDGDTFIRTILNQAFTDDPEFLNRLKEYLFTRANVEDKSEGGRNHQIVELEKAVQKSGKFKKMSEPNFKKLPMLIGDNNGQDLFHKDGTGALQHEALRSHPMAGIWINRTDSDKAPAKANCVGDHVKSLEPLLDIDPPHPAFQQDKPTLWEFQKNPENGEVTKKEFGIDRIEPPSQARPLKP